MTVEVVTRDQHDRRLGRQMVHDSRSLLFPARIDIDYSTWVSKSIRVYDPIPNPNQVIGNCTGVSKCVQFNATGNRKTGVVLKMSDAVSVYSLATSLDPWEGAYPPADTGSSGLAAAQAAQQMKLGGQYLWLLRGADEVVQAVMAGECVSVGTWWYTDMFNQDSAGRIHVGGGLAGGHQYTIRGYNKTKDWLIGRCWWGSFRDFYISRADLDALLRDGGDAHIQARI